MLKIYEWTLNDRSIVLKLVLMNDFDDEREMLEATLRGIVRENKLELS